MACRNRNHYWDRWPRFRVFTVYAVDRLYGGPEEGGWWYNWYTPLSTFPIPRTLRKVRNAAKLQGWRDLIVSRFSHLAWGNISHSTGGLEIEGRLEEYPRQDATRYRPHYE